MAVGDPAVVLSAHRLEDGASELRVSLSSVFDESMLEGFRWPLYPSDDCPEIISKINSLLMECKVADIRVQERVGGDLAPHGGRFLGVRDWPALFATH